MLAWSARKFHIHYCFLTGYYFLYTIKLIVIIIIKKGPIFASNLQENNKMSSKREAETFLVEFNQLKSASADGIINKLIKQTECDCGAVLNCYKKQLSYPSAKVIIAFNRSPLFSPSKEQKLPKAKC